MRIKVLPATHRGSISIRKILQTIRKIDGSWHLGALYQRRNYQNVPFKGALNLKTHPIVFTLNVEAALLCRPDPFGSHHRDHDVAFLQNLVEALSKVDPKRNVIDVDENRLLS